MNIQYSILIIIFCFIFSLQTQAQKATSNTFSEKSFVDSIIAAKEKSKPSVAVLGDFEVGIARTKLGDKYGIVNSEGEEICPPIYDAVRIYKNGYAAVKKDNKWVLINRQGMFLTAKV